MSMRRYGFDAIVPKIVNLNFRDDDLRGHESRTAGSGSIEKTRQFLLGASSHITPLFSLTTGVSHFLSINKYMDGKSH